MKSPTNLLADATDAVSRAFHVTADELHSPSRVRKVAEARFVLFLLLEESLRQVEIAALLFRTQSMVSGGLERCRMLMDSDPKYKAKVLAAKAIFHQENQPVK